MYAVLFLTSIAQMRRLQELVIVMDTLGQPDT